MGPDKYKVEILHYLNPHLIWALVEKDGEENNEHFEQLGVYGISPLNVSIDFDGNVETTRCKEWVPAVVLAMKKILFEASEVWFSASFSDKTTSIFDDNLHKYGDFTLKLKDGRTLSLFEYLLDTGFVDDDVGYFHQNLKTKLDFVNTVGVVNKIRQSLKSLNKCTKALDAIFNTQTSIFQKAVELEETASSRNCSIGIRGNHSQLLLNKQLNDLNACKDVDEKSAGRACRKNVARTLNSGLMKKLNSIHLVVAEDSKNASSDEKNSEIEQIEKDFYTKTSKYVAIKKNNKKGTKSNAEVPDNNKRYIALGPPGINPTKFCLKEVETHTDLPEKPAHEKEDNDFGTILSKANSEDHLDDNLIYAEKENVSNKSINNGHKQNHYEKDHNQNMKDVKHEKKAPTSVQRKMNFLKEKIAKMNTSSSTADTDSTNRQGDDSDSESITDLVSKLDLSSNSIKKEKQSEPETPFAEVKNNVNPFKNLDGSKSVFVEKLVSPSLLVHTKKGNRILPVSDLRDIPFGSDIHLILRNMSVKKPMRVQTVSWPTILRGHSLFLVSPNNSGKTLGYLPAVCRLVSDSKDTLTCSIARLTCIIICATSKSVCNVENMCKMFLHEARIFACYTGMTDVTISTAILNGCDILISTPSLLVRLMRENLGLDIRSLQTLVIDDCERISEVYQNEVKFCLSKVKEMLKSRANKELKVQYIVASRIWSNFMSSLAKKAPDSVVCIGAFQECVLYSEADTSFQFLEKEKKIESVLKFLDSIDKSKKTVIACRSDDEVDLIEKTLTSLKYVVYACDSSMNVHDLYAIDLALSEYKEPLKGPILVCCDGNLNHLNITDAHYLIHFSLPELFSMFSKRFAVLIDNFSSVFNYQDTGVKIKILLETSNVEQLPKILQFIKRCSDEVPSQLDQISKTVMLKKDLEKAKAFVPLCSTLLRLGKCADLGYCKERHTIFEDFDKPLDWIPKEGIITFKILHYHTPVHYSARLMSCTVNGGVTKYPQTYSSLSIKLGMYYSKEKNKKLHGIAKPGDLCAVGLKQNFFARCQIIKVLKYTHNNLPSLMLINLIDEEKYEMARDTSLYYLPDELKNINSHVLKVVLANIAPQDRDITYSKLAQDQIRKITDVNEDIYMRAPISLVIGNCIFVEKLEACQDLTSLNETVVKSNIREELLDSHAVNHPDHINNLLKLGENLEFVRKNISIDMAEVPKPIKVLPKARWAHLNSEGYTPVFYLHAKSPSLFFVQNFKFQNCLRNLLNDIKKHVEENPEPVSDVAEGDIVLAEFPDDGSYERARVDKIIGDKVNCFFVDLGDWSLVSVKKVLPISEKLITQLPFQAIECRLVGIRPVRDEWSEFGTNWFVDQFYESDSNRKYLFAKRFTKEKADFTEGGKYGIGLIDTSTEDVYINKLMLDANLAEENDEIEYLDAPITIDKSPKDSSDDSDSNLDVNNAATENTDSSNMDLNKSPKRGSLPSHLLSYAEKCNAYSSTPTSSANSSLEENSGTPVKENNLSDKTVSKLYTDSGANKRSELDVINTDNNELALVSPSKRASDSNVVVPSGSTSTFLEPKENPNFNQQQAIMNLLRSNPIRSMPLVNDDIDYDRWDSSNPIEMLMVPNQGKSTVAQAPKQILPATNNVKPDTRTKDEEKVGQPIDFISEDNKEKDRTTQETNSNTYQVKLDTEDVSQLWSVAERHETLILHDHMFSAKITINWSQSNSNVTMLVQFQVEKYELIIEDKRIKFIAKDNESDLGFEFELYGVVNVAKSTHSKKDKCVEINLSKVMTRTWLSLQKGCVKRIVSNNKIEKEITNEVQKKNEENLRKPKIVWRQNKTKVTMKIMLITEKYDLIIQDKHIKFYSQANDEEYGFEFELYGVIDVNKSSHSNKGQYIQANLHKTMGNNWLVLGKGYIKKWIVYDVDSIDVSTDEDDETSDEIKNLRNNLNVNHDSDTDDDFDDDVNFGYKKQY